MNKSLKTLQSYLLTRYGRRFKSRNSLLAWQQQQVAGMLPKVFGTVPFYRKHYGNLDPNNWQTWTETDRNVIVQNFASTNSLGLDYDSARARAMSGSPSVGPEITGSTTARSVAVGLSSGTSVAGPRGVFIAGESEQAQWAGAILAKCL